MGTFSAQAHGKKLVSLANDGLDYVKSTLLPNAKRAAITAKATVKNPVGTVGKKTNIGQILSGEKNRAKDI